MAERERAIKEKKRKKKDTNDVSARYRCEYRLLPPPRPSSSSQTHHHLEHSTFPILMPDATVNCVVLPTF